MQIDTSSFWRFPGPWPRRFFLSLAGLSPSTPHIWGFEGKLAWVSLLGAAPPSTLRRAPPYSLSWSIVELRQVIAGAR